MVNNYKPSPLSPAFFARNAGMFFIAATLLAIFPKTIQAQTVKIFSSSGTFVVPSCVTSITVQCWAGGGGGGGASEASGGTAGAGGGGGGFATAVLNNVGGSTFTVTVGAGGTGGTGTASTGGTSTPGGNSIVTNGTITVTAIGGGAGTGESAAGVATGIGMGGGGSFVGVFGTTYTGGNGAEGNNQDNNTGGAGGGGAGNAGGGATPANTQDDGNGTGGAGGTGNPNTVQYKGGLGGSVSADYYENGGAGDSLGGGGAGGGGETSGGFFGHGTSPGNGGNGGKGQVIITYNTSLPAITSVTGSGCPGSTITINGTLLAGATSVKIGATAVTNLTIGATVITGTVAAGTTSGTVTVVNNCGTATSAAAFTVYAAPAPVNLGTHSICGGSGYTFGGHTYTLAGVYNDTATSSVTGCDSFTTVTLVGGATINKAINHTGCAGTAYTFGANSYTTGGTYSDTTTSTVTGCDSITTLTLSFSQPITQSITQFVCGGGSYNFGGKTYTQSGIFSDTATSTVSGCDSITTLHLTITPALYSVQNQSICTGSSYMFNGQSYSLPGTYADTLHGAGTNGCDSITALILTVNSAALGTIVDSICSGGSFSFGGQTYTTAGIYTDTIHNGSVGGCDSITTLTLTLKSGTGTPVVATTTQPEFCSGDSVLICATTGFVSYSWSSGNTTACFYTPNADNYSVTVTDANGCTSGSNHVVVGTYTPAPVTISVSGDTLSSYSATSYQWELNGQPIPGDTTSVIVATQSGNYIVEITDSNGCHYSSSATAVTTAITNLQNSDAIKIYPNPLTTGSWQLNVSENMLGAAYEIFDASGRSVAKSVITDIYSAINLNSAAGIYELRITTTESNYNLKLIKLY